MTQHEANPRESCAQLSTAYWKSTGLPIPRTFSSVGGLLTFVNTAKRDFGTYEIAAQ